MDNSDKQVVAPKPGRRGRWWVRPAVLLALVIVAIVLARVLRLDRQFSQLQGWVAGLGAWGPVVFVSIYAGATVLALPGSVFTVMAGAVFGTLVGTLCVSVGSTVGAALCFLISRYFARGSFEQKIQESERFRKLDRLSEEKGSYIVALTRLVPLFPFNFLNYAFGLTRVRFWTYTFWSWLCMLPMTFVYVSLGHTGGEALAKGRVDWRILLVAGGVILLLLFVVRYARRKLAATGPAGEDGQAAAPTEEAPAFEDEVEIAPGDAYNDELIARVHPANWCNPEPSTRYNLVVIGAGTAGLVTAAGAAGLGAKVALVEANLLGGDCLNVGCVPSKCLIRSARAFADVRDAGGFGIDVPGTPRADFGTVMARMRRLRASLCDHDSAERFRELGVDVFFGRGRFDGPGRVRVGDRTLRYVRAVIATGARAARPGIPGLAEAGFLTNETVFSLTECPGRLAVIGAGPLGCEIAQAFQRLGARVTVIGRSGRILSREDADAGQIVEESMRRDGVRFLFDCAVERVERQGGDKVLHATAQGESLRLPFDEILVAVGRAPNVRGLNLGSVGVEYRARDGIVVDDHLRTTNRRIYAAGDVCQPHKFTHTADAAARIVIRNALFHGRARQSALVVPWCTYTDPEIAHVGLCELDAPVGRTETIRIPFEDVDRAVVDGETAGLLKVLVPKGKDRILGATIVASHAGEMISEVTLGMVGGLGLATIAGTIHPYPTQAEAIRKAGDAFNRTRLTSSRARLFGRYLAWQRHERTAHTPENGKGR